MTQTLLERQALGLDDTHLVEYDDRVKVHRQLLAPLLDLSGRLQNTGCQLAVASGYRSFDQQLTIFNAKATGERPILDDKGRPVEINGLSDREVLFAILRFSALPGASRHHWGTDIDVFDPAALPTGYRLQLVPSEYASDGIFHALCEALPNAIAPAGFFRPYQQDLGGIAPEPWHLSCAAIAQPYAEVLSKDILRQQLAQTDIKLKHAILDNIDSIYRRFIAVGEC
ncbi:M15 family metallopeptidase [Gilvimarinus sp. 1_MG-2023]|uniref:M15 family metallopeptidase n=1 Tax=Gilvimarinus sp. 1_MG-2023 TaxID=3062638 RepID=UPI0026E3C670|nr:M15 family metallopeptidase [Gilvimarinus sp. 1_MG-2023]MDO6746994.1 M15 family metallopeptidase [Gilvimarinus sp. 1_MG-2023]